MVAIAESDCPLEVRESLGDWIGRIEMYALAAYDTTCEELA